MTDNSCLIKTKLFPISYKLVCSKHNFFVSVLSRSFDEGVLKLSPSLFGKSTAKHAERKKNPSLNRSIDALRRCRAIQEIALDRVAWFTFDHTRFQSKGFWV
jgi:hypothetical protein